MNPLKPRERMLLPRQAMPEQSPAERATNFQEVNLGLGSDAATAEARRCLQCRNPRCRGGCPVGVDVSAFIDLVLSGDYLAAAAKMREDNVLPAITGRVCPQEEQCEGACVMGRRVEPIAIGNLERFIADWERSTGRVGLPPRVAPTGKRVAIVGSGPAGLAAAGDLVQRGHGVRVFEALHEFGGVLVYGIPEFRLPKQIVRDEIENLHRMGIEFETDVVVGRTVTLDELLGEEGYDAVFVATGAGLPRFLGVPGEHLNGVCSANEFLTRVNLMRANRFPEYDQPMPECRGRDVMVVGGGNTAMDAVRTARRLGARSARLVYRRSEAEMPARAEEIRHARHEGIEIVTLANPVAFEGDARGWLEAVWLQRMELGAPDASGRPKPVPVAGSEVRIPLSVAVIATGTSANPLIQSTTPDLATRRGGYIEASADTLRTSKVGVFAGGDIVTGGATVILAMGAGRRAARSIDDWLSGSGGPWTAAEGIPCTS
jgi:glutamate synthase (NADPH/NADH) small chain